MSINSAGHFSSAPQVDIQRSRFKRPSTHKTTFCAGKFVPIYLDEVLPGDTVTMDMASLVRMSTPIFPVMDSAYLDIFWFYVPSRLLWQHWRELNGENTQTYWTQTTEYNVPEVWAPEDGWNVGSVADHFGIPTGVGGHWSVSALPFRAYVMCWNEFMRDQNYMSPAYFNVSDIGGNGRRAASVDDTWDGIQTALYGGTLLPVAKRHDMFTSVLPAPQKSEPMELPFLYDDYVPVGSLAKIHDFGVSSVHTNFDVPTEEYSHAVHVTNGGELSARNTQSTAQASTPLAFDNLWADLTGINVGTISELRTAFQIQRLFEKDARSGTRYTEILQGHFGVTSPDSRLQRPEYLGGTSVPVNVQQVIQTSATEGGTPQGNTAAFSLTTDVSNSFTKSFTEHGYLMAFCCVRTNHTYQQGLDKLWLRRRRFDFYWPALCSISEQPILRSQIFVSNDDEIEPSRNVNNQVFGYQEAWSEYRYHPSVVTGAFRSTYETPLDSWHYADYYGDANTDPFIADRDFMAETYVNVDRTLAVQANVEDQFLADFYFDSTWTRPMPMYSIPGLIDHF